MLCEWPSPRQSKRLAARGLVIESPAEERGRHRPGQIAPRTQGPSRAVARPRPRLRTSRGRGQRVSTERSRAGGRAAFTSLCDGASITSPTACSRRCRRPRARREHSDDPLRRRPNGDPELYRVRAGSPPTIGAGCDSHGHARPLCTGVPGAVKPSAALLGRRKPPAWAIVGGAAPTPSPWPHLRPEHCSLRASAGAVARRRRRLHRIAFQLTATLRFQIACTAPTP
jgi:hypothetical protein